MKKTLILLAALFGNIFLFSQESEIIGKTLLSGKWVNVMLTDEGDTLYIADNLIQEISLTSPRKFKTREEYLRYRRYLRYAAKVYPYAKEAIKIFNELEYATQNMKKGKRKKHIRKLQKRLKTEFEDPLKKLTKTQGLILTKMIERETEKSMYNLIKGLKGGVSATYWSTASRFWGYRLKNRYKEGEDPILDVVLKDFNVSYRMENEN
ncbi:DUF4294 domain-containing protein [Saprospiraceae bacterium]|jgi:uncharacterized short protein YbdD (DUF466 family)|nr:DUF4294 domain-containing protein [Bacteroidota bacterium]MDB4727988.1 DUF4294 domain-containing protein [Saprospiraceae bacterium]MDF1868736.1 DUF4294 domain-containing protein [Saprospiraceae bacterium]